MSEDLHHIDKIFKDSIEEHEEMPSQHVWDVIDSNLDKNKINHSSRKYNRLKRVAILLVLILLSITIYDLDMKYPGEEGAKGNNNILITHKKEISKNDSDTGQNSIRKQNHDNQPEEAIKGAEIINVDDKVQPGNSIGKSDDVTAAIGKKNITRGVTADKSKNRNENRLQSRRTAMAFNKDQNSKTDLNKKEEKDLVDKLVVTGKKTNKQAFIIPLSIMKAENPSLYSFLAARKIIVIVPRNKVVGNAESQHLKQSRFSATIFFSSDFPFYHLQNDSPGNRSVNNIKNSEKPDLSTTTGIWVDYKLNDHWNLQSGVSYSNTIILIDPKTIYAENDITGTVKYRYDASSGYGYVLPSFANSPNVGDSLYAFTSTHTLRYLNIPLAVKYNLQKGKFNFFISVGISSNILLEGIIETVVENNSNNESEIMNHLHGLKKVYFSGLSSIGAEYKLNHKFSLMVSPIRRFAINSINKNAPVKSYPDLFGISAGIHMQF